MISPAALLTNRTGGNLLINGKGKNGGWFGWPDDPKIDALRDAFARSSSPEEQKKIAVEIQQEIYD
jgi:peptide/nickel transport system substrate-binding protein